MAKSDSGAAAAIQLSGKLGIHCVGELHDELQSALDADGAVQFDASDVSHIDTAALQLIVAFRNGLRKQGRSLECVAESDIFTEFVTLLDLGEIGISADDSDSDDDDLLPVF